MSKQTTYEPTTYSHTYFYGVCEKCGALDTDDDYKTAVVKAEVHMTKKHQIDLLEGIQMVTTTTTSGLIKHE